MVTTDNDILMKMGRFEDEIMGSVAQLCTELDDEAEEYRTAELGRHEESNLAEAYSLIQAEVSELSVNETKGMSRRKTELKKRLYMRREEYSKLIFAQARVGLLQFAKSPAYEAFLVAKLQKLCAKCNMEGARLRLKAEDLCYVPALTCCCSGLTVESTDEILIGGILLENSGKGYFADETLDTALEDQKEWFAGNSGFILTI